MGRGGRAGVAWDYEENTEWVGAERRRRESRSAMMTRGETGSCCVRGGHGGSYVVPRVDVSTICDEYLCGLMVTMNTGTVERCPPVLVQAGVEYDADGWP